jgi:hypothetical protein
VRNARLYGSSARRVEGTRINRVVLLLTAGALLLALGIRWVEGPWAALWTFAILLIVILRAAPDLGVLETAKRSLQVIRRNNSLQVIPRNNEKTEDGSPGAPSMNSCIAEALDLRVQDEQVASEVEYSTNGRHEGSRASNHRNGSNVSQTG